MSIGVKLAACLSMLGLLGEEVEFDHYPALALRLRTPEGGYIPDELDPRYIRPMLKDKHKIKTFGSGATTAGSDIGNAAKIKRIEKDPSGGEEFRRRILAKEPRKERKKQKIPSRPFRRPKK